MGWVRSSALGGLLARFGPLLEFHRVPSKRRRLRTSLPIPRAFDGESKVLGTRRRTENMHACQLGRCEGQGAKRARERDIVLVLSSLVFFFFAGLQLLLANFVLLLKCSPRSLSGIPEPFVSSLQVPDGLLPFSSSSARCLAGSCSLTLSRTAPPSLLRSAQPPQHSVCPPSRETSPLSSHQSLLAPPKISFSSGDDALPLCRPLPLLPLPLLRPANHRPRRRVRPPSPPDRKSVV